MRNARVTRSFRIPGRDELRLVRSVLLADLLTPLHGPRGGGPSGDDRKTFANDSKEFVILFFESICHSLPVINRYPSSIRSLIATLVWIAGLAQVAPAQEIFLGGKEFQLSVERSSAQRE